MIVGGGDSSPTTRNAIKPPMRPMHIPSSGRCVALKGGYKSGEMTRSPPEMDVEILGQVDFCVFDVECPTFCDVECPTVCASDPVLDIETRLFDQVTCVKPAKHEEGVGYTLSQAMAFQILATKNLLILREVYLQLTCSI